MTMMMMMSMIVLMMVMCGRRLSYKNMTLTRRRDERIGRMWKQSRRACVCVYVNDTIMFTTTCCERCCSSVCPTSGCIIQQCPAAVPATSAVTLLATRSSSGGARTAPSPGSCCWISLARRPLPVASPPDRCCRSVRSLWHYRSSRCSDEAANRRGTDNDKCHCLVFNR